jgi:selenocysteine-specific elongation factor
MNNVIVGTAGHIDHGKSALVEALTGTNPDRLEEEKRRGITIDLGFAFLELGGVRFGFVDVPGHERFVRNMLAGVGGFDVVLLVIAADESIKPQTREHFDICRLLAIPRGLTVITKTDLVEPDTLELVRLEVEDFLRASFLDGAPVVPVSARTGAGLDDLKKILQRVAADVPAKDASRHFRLPIDRVFAIRGFGTVVTGTLVSGAVQPEDEVELFPARRRLRVRGVQSGGKSAPRAVAGQRTAVNLAGIEVEEIHRGMVLASPGLFEPTQRIDARVALLPSARKLKDRARVHFHQGTAETVAEVVLLDRAELPPGESTLAQLRLADPVLVLQGDRFILRQFSPVITIGGGAVVHNLAPRHRRGEKSLIPMLESLEQGRPEEVLYVLALTQNDGLGLAQIVGRTGWQESEVRRVAAELAERKKLQVLSEQPLCVATRSVVEAAMRRARDEVAAFHKANPLADGISKEDLRGRVVPGSRRESAELFRAALEELVAAREIAIAGDTVKRAGREIALLPEEAKAREQIERQFEGAGLAVPSVKEVLAKLPIEAKRAQKLLQILLREGTLVKVTEELVFHRAAVARLRELLAGYKKAKGERLPIGAFKELTGITRKYAIPLLEYLDRERVTRRVGDERVIL